MDKALELEKDLIDNFLWDNYKIPKGIKRIADKYKFDGSIGIGFNNQVGWFVMITAGQGPVVLYQQFKSDKHMSPTKIKL
jgi:hypothetical protein